MGAAISGISLVCGENVCGIDPELEFNKNGKVKARRKWSAEWRPTAAIMRATAISWCR